MRHLRLCLALAGACILTGAAVWSWGLPWQDHRARLHFRIGDRGEIDLAAIALRTVAVGPAREPWPAPASRAASTRVELPRGPATELVQGMESSIEQSWR